MLTSSNSEKSQLTKNLDIKEAQLAKTSADLDSLSRELQNKIEEVKKLGGDTVVLYQMQRALRSDLAMAKKAANDGQAAKEEIERLEERIKLYMVQLKEKDDEIARLIAEREQMSKENTSLKTKVSSSMDSLSKLDRNRRELADKIGLASILRAENISLFAIDRKGREEENDSFRGKKLDQLGVEFNIADNKVAKQETKEIMLVVTDPSGNTLSDPATGGGSFTVSGMQTNYSSKQSFMFDNNRPKVTFRWKPVSRLAAGTYTASIYCEGYKIGEAPFEIR